MRKNPWLENSIKNILPLSLSSNFKEALKEWSFTGEVVDHNESIEICEMCEHQDLRYHYEIENSGKGNYLWVGSSCILRFQEIVVLGDTGVQLIDENERRKVLEKALKEKQINIALEPLRTLWRKDREYRKSIEGSVTYFKIKKGFTPKALAILCEKMAKYGIEYNPKSMPVYLRANIDQIEIVSLSEKHFEYVKACMSPKQLAKSESLRSQKNVK